MYLLLLLVLPNDISQVLEALNCFECFLHIYLFQFSTCFEHSCAHQQENQLY